MSAVYCDYCRPFKTGFDMLGIIRNTGNTVYDNVSISAQLFDEGGNYAYGKHIKFNTD